MTISRGQMERQLRMGGGIMDVVPREPAIFGGIKKAVKKVGKTVGKIAKSDIGKAALLYAGTAGLGALGAGKGFGSLLQGSTYLPGSVLGNLGASATNLFKGRAMGVDKFDNIIRGPSGISKALSTVTGGGIKGNAAKLATLGLVSTFLTTELGMTEEQAEEELARDPSTYLEQYYRNLNPPTADTNSEQYEAQVRDFVATNTSEYAVGGRVGLEVGTPREGIGSIMSQDPNALGLMSIPIEDEIVIERDLSKATDPKYNEEGIPPEIIGKGFEGDEEIFIIETPRGGTMMITKEDYIENFVNKMAQGGRIGFADGPVLPPDPTQPVNPFGPKPIGPVLPNKEMAGYGYDDAMSDTYDSYLEMKRKGLIPPTMEFDEFLLEVVPEMGNKKIEETRNLAAIGGKMDSASDNAMQAAGIEGLPIRQNPKGVKELDLRETGGFIQPVGIKEKEDDIPAMLSNNEFVFTADAVRGMGDGNVNVGAQRMYDMMKKLEAGGRV